MRTLAALYFMLPAYVANMVPPLIAKWRFLGTPMDFGARIRGKRVLGDHKTWRGFIFGTIAGTIVFWIQQQLTPAGSALALFDYNGMSLLLGFLLSAGALIGDAAKSFLKRQAGIKPGKPMPVFDQLDYVAGAIIIASPIFLPAATDIVLIVGWSILLTIAVKNIGYHLGVNDTRW